jgi:hypothetical protein
MKIQIDEDERYPFYSVTPLDNPHEPEIEVPEADLARWEAAMVAFDAAQAEMAQLHERAWGERAEKRKNLFSGSGKVYTIEVIGGGGPINFKGGTGGDARA